MRLAEALKILKCPDCPGGALEQSSPGDLGCSVCGRHYHLREDGIWEMLPSSGPPLPEQYSDPDYLKWKQVSVHRARTAGLFHRLIEDSAHKWVSRKWDGRDSGLVLDLGCGTGAHFSSFRDLSKVVGLDYHLPSLRCLKERYPEAFLILGDAYSLPFRDGVFSALVAIYLLEHLYHLEKGLNEIHRVLRGGGMFWVGLPCEGGFLWDTVRKFTTEISNSRKYGLDYSKVARLEHCNRASEILDALRQQYSLAERGYYPAGVPSVNLNFTVTARMAKN